MSKFKEIKGEHIYVNNKGESVPSVTSIIKIINKPEIAVWANSLGFKYINYEEHLSSLAAIGTDFHQMVADYTSGKEVGGMHFPEAIELFKKFTVWAKNHYYSVIASEFSLVSDYFGGTIDAIATIDGELSLVDYKTSKKVYPSHFIQLAGYSLLIKELMPDTYEKLRGFSILTMRCTTQMLHTVTKKELEEKYVKIFNNALELYLSYREVLGVIK